MPFTAADFIHPEDRAAKEQLEAIPGFTLALKTVMRAFNEQMLHGLNMAQKVRLSSRQLPQIYSKLPPICQKLGIEEPEFYLEMNPSPNAYTYGDSRIFITITSGLLEHLTDEEVEAVLAHECGHVVCRHVLYRTMADLLLLAGSSILGPIAAVAAPIKWGLLYWARRSEFSADRAAAVAMGSAKPVVNTMIRLSGGPKCITDQVDIDLYMKQADDYDKLLDSSWDKLLQGFAVLNNSHPFPAVRTREIMRWCGSSDYQRLMNAMNGVNGQAATTARAPVCPSCGRPIEPTWRFCNECGAPLSQTSITPATV
jgi:Zn-dependent protease with chaperone function